MAEITVIGNAGKEAELKFLKGAKGDFALASFSIAETLREFKDGQWINGETIWWKVTATGELAEACADLIEKGKKFFVKGDLKPFEYQNKAGETKSGFEIRAKTVAAVLTAKPKAQGAGWSDNPWN